MIIKEKERKLIELNTFLNMTEMCDIACSYGTDKYQHGYTRIYYEIMKDIRYKEDLSIFEIGIYMGNSIKMWNEFFPFGKIYGIDNGRIVANSTINVGQSNENPSPDDIKLLSEGAVIESYNFDWLESHSDRIKCGIADQRSESQLNICFNKFGCNVFDIILDDAQHFQEHQQKSISFLFKNVKPGGYYIIEDVCNFEYIRDNNKFWGQKGQDCTDSTDFVFTKFIETGILESDYMTKEEASYIKNNTEDIFLYDCIGKNNSPINGTSKLLVIKKK